MVDIKKNSLPYLNSLSWEKSTKNLYRIQNRLFKAVYVGDIKKALLLQKLILNSNSSRILAIREVTQISINRKISGVDGKTFLTFTERFELSEFLKLNVNNWYPQSFKAIRCLKKDGTTILVKVPVIADRVWQCVVSYAIEPAHLALFHPQNFNLYYMDSIFNLQKLILLNMTKASNGNQKRVLIINLEETFSDFNINNLLKKIIAPRGVKLGIFRSLRKGLLPGFFEESKDIFSFNALLANIILNGIEDLHFCLRCNSNLLFFLYPSDKEKVIVKKVNSFLEFSEVKLSIINAKVYSSLEGFTFLNWNFVYSLNKEAYSVPSYSNYQGFLKRIKQIINNSNYGAVSSLMISF